MKGWTETEFADRNLLAPCGLYCGACGVYLATRNGDAKFKERLGALYGSAPEETECLGCMQPDPPKTLYGYCRQCPIRDCVRSRGFYSCHQCADWPCSLVTGFPLATGRRVMARAIPLWRSRVACDGPVAGDAAWAREECARYHCPDCGEPLFRGAQRCRACGAAVAERLDGTL
jgi:predicted RNA-binding Zn-ribbon protein involved in translation (DUF1610 family)